MPNADIFALAFTHDSMTAAFVTPDGVEEGAAGFDLTDFLAGDSQPLDKFLALLSAKLRTAPAGCAAVAVTLPCDLDASRRKVIYFPRAPWLSGVQLPELLSQSLGLPVVMEKRAVASLAYDRARLGLPDEALVVGCYIDTHYESAIWHGGRPILGRNGIAGTIGHLTIHDREDSCFCGKTGCVDLYGAGTRLRQIHTMIFPDTRQEELFTRHGEHPLLRDYLSMMAYPVAMELNVIDPDILVIGGSVTAMADFPHTFLQEEIRRHAYSPFPAREVAFLTSATTAATGAACAAQYARMKLGEPGPRQKDQTFRVRSASAP